MMRRLYGAGPLHLLGHVLAIAVAAYALARAFQPRFAPQPLDLAAWLLAGALLHDLILLPAYSGVDRLVQRVLRGDRRRAVPVLNHVRVPAVLSGVVLLVYAPRILDRQPHNVVNALGHPPADYAARWLALTAVLAAGSAALYAVRWRRRAILSGVRHTDAPHVTDRHHTKSVAPTPGDPDDPPPPADQLRVELHAGPRAELRPLFELAEDSAAELDSYLDAGRVLVAVAGDGVVVGHLQLTDTDDPSALEVKNMAVAVTQQGRGVGRRLVGAALDLARREGAATLVVATAAADIGNLRFYQRLGFRMRTIERDAFTAATGYADVDVDGIPLRDRVWFDRPVPPAAGSGPTPHTRSATGSPHLD